MSQWRVVWLQGDPEFLDSLYQFTANHRFTLGSGTVAIRGGERRNLTESEEERNRYLAELRRNRRDVNMKAVTQIVQQTANDERKETEHLVTICDGPEPAKLTEN